MFPFLSRCCEIEQASKQVCKRRGLSGLLFPSHTFWKGKETFAAQARRGQLCAWLNTPHALFESYLTIQSMYLIKNVHVWVWFSTCTCTHSDSVRCSCVIYNVGPTSGSNLLENSFSLLSLSPKWMWVQLRRTLSREWVAHEFGIT